MQTNGTYFTKEMINNLEKAGLNRIHLSIHTTNPEQGKELMGSEDYQLEKIIETTRYIANSKIELLLAPVALPGINDIEIEKLIELSKELNCKIGIQKYETYKYSRKLKKLKKESYYRFYKRLSELEKKYNIKLIYHREDLEVKKGESLEKPIEIGKKINSVVLGEGWFENQKITSHKGRSITVKNCDSQEGDKINLRVIENKNNIYIAEKI